MTVVALSGGVGGAKLALGLSRVLPAEELLVVCNTGDDFEHLGLCISPDIDTVMYTLAGVANPELGWGRGDETWSFMETLDTLGGETWFRLGDRDLAVHVERTRRLRAGETLSAITADLCARLGVGPRVLPMSDDPVRTRLRTDEGWIDFQDYFVRRRCEPVVHEAGVPWRRDGARAARFPGGTGRSATEGGGDLPVQPVHQHRADPCGARRARGAGRLRGAGGRGVAADRRTRDQGADSEDDGGAWHCRPAPAAWRVATTT